MIFAWALATYGITVAITQSLVGAPLRRLFSWSTTGAHFITCAMCVGWWVGLMIAALAPALSPVPRSAAHVIVVVLLNAFASLAWSWTAHVVLVRLGSLLPHACATPPTRRAAPSVAAGAAPAERPKVAILTMPTAR